MSETQIRISHRHERTIQAPIEDVWRTLTDSDDVRCHFYDSGMDSSLMPGAALRYVTEDGVVTVEGVVEEVDEPHRLVHSFAVTAEGDAAAASDAPSRVTWALEPSDEGTHVLLVHDGFAGRTATWRYVEDAWEQILDGLSELDADEDED
ncbi:MAG: transcriptional regulator, ArsR family [Thermoleophilia bacterium]|nr:transcriptional regulator, ArsR family [Thermoleophilia bacterium]